MLHMPSPMMMAAGESDPDVAAYFGAMTVQPVEDRKVLIRALIAGLKTDGLWDLLDALYLLASHDRQSALLNVKSRLYDLTGGGSVSFTADRGTQASGTASNSNAFDTGWQGGLTARRNDCHFGYVSPVNSLQNSDAVGAASGSSYLSYIRPRNTSGTASFKVNVSASGSTASVTTQNGHWIANRTGSSASALYQNNVSRSTNGSSSSSHSNPLFIHAAGNGTGADAFSSRISAAHAGLSMASPQRSALQSRLNTYLSAIGAT